MTAKAERNAEIVRRILAGEQMSVLAREYGISRQRVDQIRARYSVPCVGPASGPRSGMWKGGRMVHRSGYVMLRRPNHPRTTRNGYVMEHVLVAEAVLGRPLVADEVVHHVNGVKHDNRPENLQVLSRGEHCRIHNLRYSREVLGTALQWYAIRLGRTPTNADLRPPKFPIWFVIFYKYFGSLSKAAVWAGLTGSSQGQRPAPLPLGFRSQHADLLRYPSVEALIDDRFGGLLTQHEREKLFSAPAKERAA